MLSETNRNISRQKYFFPKVSRRDFFCIYPTGINELCEEELFVVDEFEEWEKIKSMNEEDVLQKVISKIEKQLSVE